LLRHLGVRDPDLRHTIQLRLTGQPSVKTWGWTEWRCAVEVLKAIADPEQREQLVEQGVVAGLDPEMWLAEEWCNAIAAIRRAFREPRQMPELPSTATQRQLRWIRDLAKAITWREENGLHRFVAKMALADWNQAELDAWVANGSFETLSREEASAAIRALKKERRLQRQRKAAAAAAEIADCPLPVAD